MSAQTDVFVRVDLTGLEEEQLFSLLATDGTTPTLYTKQRRVLGTADTPEAVDLGNVSTVAILAIEAIDYDLDIDLDYVDSFDADLTIKAGEPAALIPNPAGTVYVNGSESDETPAYKYLVIGT